MTEEHTKTLLETFPELYKEFYLPMTQTCMCWGFDTGDGWYDLLYTLSAAITDEVRRSGCPPVTVTQVKEKYAGLRYYYNGGNDATDSMIELAEQMSYRICETCGKPGKVRGQGWYYTSCNEHAREEDKDE